MRRLLEAVIEDSGIWRGSGRDTHSFCYTAEAFVLSNEQHGELLKLGLAVKECLAGVSRMLVTASHRQVCRGSHWNLIRDLSTADIPRYARGYQTMRPDQIPYIVKVDLVEGADGRLNIIEIDSQNRRAMGYASLFASIREAAMPGQNVLPGIAITLAHEVKQRNRTQLVLVYTHYERFYLPEFQILEQALAKQGVELVVVSELEAKMVDGVFFVRGQRQENPLFVNVLLLCKNRALEDAMGEDYRNGALQTLMPMKPFLGAKNMLALLRNDTGDRPLECILRAHIGERALLDLRSHLPVTYPVMRRNSLPPTDGYVLKRSVSSGAKGVIFPNDPAFTSTFALARSKPGTWIMQQRVQTKQRNFSFYSPEDKELRRSDFNTRIVVYFMDGVPAEAVVTASHQECVHGGREALNMGVVIR